MFNQKTKMKYCIMAIILALCFCLSACQPTPEKEVIVNKNDGKLEEKIQAEATQAITANEAEMWTQELETLKGTKIHVNAELHIPEVEKYPVVRVKTTGFTDEQLKKVVEVLSQGLPIYALNETNTTKEAVEQRIVEIKKQMETASAEDSQGLEFLLPILEDLHAVAPTIAEWEQTREQIDVNSLDKSKAMIAMDLGMGYPSTLGVYDNRSASNTGDSCYMEFSNLGLEDGFVNTYYPKDVTISMKTSMEEATAKAQSLIKDMGILDMQLSEIGIGTKNISSTNPDDQCYNLIFKRTVNDVFSPYVFSSAWKNNTQENPSADDFRARWVAENIQIQINDKGLRTFKWENPIEIIEMVSENVNMLSIDEVKEKFAGDMQIRMADPAATEGWEKGIEISIDRVSLGMQFIPAKDNMDEYTMMPCWVFYGKDSTSADSVSSFGVAQLILNAIDGSIV